MRKRAKESREIFLQIEEGKEGDDIEVHLAKELGRPRGVEGRTIGLRLERALLVLIDLDSDFARAAIHARALFRFKE